MRVEPQDVSGFDPDAAIDVPSAQTDQHHPFILRAYVQIAAGDTKVLSFRQKDLVGLAASSRDIIMSIKRVSA